ncbi:MAG: DUF3179 domain-containing protein [Acidobacteria bacterium]|nr:DUF3179 domain-containing protein [Acidobacteriota bacterium]
MRSSRRTTCLAVILLSASLLADQAPTPPPPLDLFAQAAAVDDKMSRQALDAIASNWKDSYTPMIIDMVRLMRRAPRQGGSDIIAPSFGDEEVDGSAAGGQSREGAGPRPVPRESIVRARLLRFLEKQTGKRFDDTLNGWREWMWALPYEPHPQYGEFKGIVYSQIDPRMRAFFPPGVQSRIRLDEIDWGGVPVNGIPPLVYPRVVAAQDASYMRDGHIVFGVAINGEARAYPKRILAWHELAIDRVGAVELTVVYCTLCGTVIPYESTVAGRLLRFGTSGLLYRSNKLMFDEQTASLWNSIEGTPVVGPLSDKGGALTPREVVTTTWGEWRTTHPNTTVLSLDTGHKRDYGEGVAYRDYFASDSLYFGVSQVDRRLKNKTEVLTLRVRPRAGGTPQPVAIEVAFLKRNPVFHLEVEGSPLVVVTSPKGANRVYDVRDRSVVLRSTEGHDVVTDANGARWRVTEEFLTLESDVTQRLPRVAAARAFWFGWYAQFPKTLLIK